MHKVSCGSQCEKSGFGWRIQTQVPANSTRRRGIMKIPLIAEIESHPAPPDFATNFCHEKQRWLCRVSLQCVVRDFIRAASAQTLISYDIFYGLSYYFFSNSNISILWFSFNFCVHFYKRY